MKGHIRERSPGHWAIVIDGVDPQGKRRRKWRSFVGGKREAQIECARLISQKQNGADIIPRARLSPNISTAGLNMFRRKSRHARMSAIARFFASMSRR